MQLQVAPQGMLEVTWFDASCGASQETPSKQKALKKSNFACDKISNTRNNMNNKILKKVLSTEHSNNISVLMEHFIYVKETSLEGR